MITELATQNFKSWATTGALRFAPLTGFFGANSSGKTSILQVLLMLKQTVECPPDWNEPLYFGDEESLVNLGSFEDVIHGHKQGQTLRITVSWRLDKMIYIQERSTDSISLGMDIKKLDNGQDSVWFCYTNKQNWKVERTTNGQIINSPGLQDRVGAPTGPLQIGLFRCYGVPEKARPADRRLKPILTCQAEFESLFSRILHLGPLREYPRQQYTWEGDHPKGIGQHGEKAISAMLSGRVQLLAIEKQILKWLQRLDLIDSYRLQPDFSKKGGYDFYVTKHRGGPEVRLKDVGFGVSQVLPVLILCYYVPEGSILILEQPEAHLHPKAQSELADVLIDVVKNRNIQIILESHSEHLIHRLTRRIAEEQLATTDTALYSCQINEGVSEIEPLEMDEYGNISNWPQNFFGDEMGDLAAKAKAEIERRKANKQ